MQKTIYAILFSLFVLLFVQPLSAQYLEVGVHAGGTAYTGDLSPQEFGLFVTDFNMAGGAYVRIRPLNRVGIRLNAAFSQIGAERDYRVVNENEEFVTITRNFRSNIAEYTALLEWDVFYLGNQNRNFGTLYVMAGGGALKFNPQAQIDGIYYDLQPLRTEGQGATEESPAPYNLTTVVGTLGAGIRARFSERIVLGVELGGRYTNTDYLDDISGRTVNYQQVLANSGTLAAQFSYPAIENVAAVNNDFEYRRGGPNKDYYWMGNVTIGVTIGRARGETRQRSGCFRF